MQCSAQWRSAAKQVATYSGNIATIPAVTLPTGGRWIPNFNPNQIINNLWGTLTFTFTDGDHGKVDSALPRTARIAEVDLNIGGDREVLVVRHLP